MTGTIQEVFGSLALQKTPYQGLIKGLVTAFRDRVTGPYAARKRIRRTLEEIERLSERELYDLGYTRDQLRAAVLTGTGLRH